jgi:hypothetical protein
VTNVTAIVFSPGKTVFFPGQKSPFGIQTRFISNGSRTFTEGIGSFSVRENRPLPRKNDIFFFSCTMKKTFFLILIGLFSCRMEKTPDERLWVHTDDSDDWVTYEGRLPLDEERDLHIELSLLEGTRFGEGSYQLKEFVDEKNIFTEASSFHGNYATLYGEEPGELIIQLLNSAQPEGLKRTYLTPGFKGGVTNSRLRMIREEVFRKTDLTLKISGRDKLVVLDEALDPVSSDPNQLLSRRTSKLFTVEGYFTHKGDTADFLEMNTRVRWAVSKHGEYDQAIRQYHTLTTDKFEVTYIKAVGYSIRHTNREGREIDALVFKRIIQMTSSSTLTEEYHQMVR